MDTYLKLTMMVAITSAANINIGRGHLNEDEDDDSREEGGGDREWSQVAERAWISLALCWNWFAVNWNHFARGKLHI